MPAARSILIVGAGIAGLTSAIALRRHGIHVTIVEIKRDWLAQTGVGLTLVGNALRALATIDLAEECVRQGMPANHINVRTADGTLIGEQPSFISSGPNVPGHASISRSALHRLLTSAAVAAGVQVRLATSFRSCEQTADNVEVTFTDGSVDRFDLLIGADGIYSKVREMLFPAVKPTPTGQAVWRAPIPRPEAVVTSELHVGGRHGVVGICPISARDAYVYIVEAASISRYEDDRLHEIMRERLQGYGGFLPKVASTLTSAREVSYRPLEWLLVPDPWYRGRVVLIGDAAHSNPPVLAQGAAMGIEDAVVLAEELVKHTNVAAALQTFMSRRFERARMVVENSVRLAEAEVNHDPTLDVRSVLMHAAITLAQPI